MRGVAYFDIETRWRSIKRSVLPFISLVVLISVFNFAKAKDSFECGGAVEVSTWKLWDDQGRGFLRDQLLGNRLLRQGDIYALYDMQVYLQNLEAMGHRCKRIDRLIQLADDLIDVYSKLEPIKKDATDLAWVCRGGAICNEKNHLIKNEVMAVSAQGLGLMSALANDLATAEDSGAHEHPFIAKTVEVSTQHLLRWGSEKAIENWSRLIAAKSEDVKDASSALFFTDKDLWQIAIYANLAGIYGAKPELRLSFEEKPNRKKQLEDSIRTLLKFFKARTTLKTIASPVLGNVTLADIDQGYSRLYPENRYAAYAGVEKPAICGGGVKSRKPKLMIDPDTIPAVSDLGWDISHARRLVHAMNALHKNQEFMQQSYGLSSSELPPMNISAAFAAQLVIHVWNGDKKKPLFTNYWSGANGWYRVAYGNGTETCYPGYPPFGLSDSFATGGYATWSSFYPLIGEIAHAIYDLTQVQNEVGAAYTETYLTGLAPHASANIRMLTQLMFWPSLVQ